MSRFTMAAAVAGCMLLGCNSENTQDMAEFAIDAALKQEMENVRDKRIFFGHQSVGQNIMDGVEDLKRRANVDGFNVIRYKPGIDIQLPPAFLAHEWVGDNRDPQSKFDAFCKIIDKDLAGMVDIALVKLCYVDIDRNSDVEAVFNAYVKSVEDLKSRHPHLVVVPVTTALMVKGGYNKYKTMLKDLLGRENDNVKRNAFNAMVRERFKGQPLFDLAAASATYPDGKRNTYGKDGSQEGLIEGYTYDGGHLNEYGRQAVAREMIRVLASIQVPRTQVKPDTASLSRN